MDKLHNWKEWIGTDESGKGDYFGPLVVTAVLVNPDCIEEFRKQEIVDGKKITLKRIQKIAEWLWQHYEDNIVVIKKLPRDYNSVYEKMKKENKNLNDMLADMHIETIRRLSIQTGIKNVIIDKFSYHDIITPRLENNNFQLELVTGGERDIAVAAASIIARDTFRRELTSLSQTYNLDLPPGANNVINVGREFMRIHGEENLKNVVKLHFKTTKQVLNQESD